jgi:hypothetical protein
LRGLLSGTQQREKAGKNRTSHNSGGELNGQKVPSKKQTDARFLIDDVFYSTNLSAFPRCIAAGFTWIYKAGPERAASFAQHNPLS